MAKDGKASKDDLTFVVDSCNEFDVLTHNPDSGTLTPVAEVTGKLVTAFKEGGDGSDAVSVLSVESVRPPNRSTRKYFGTGHRYTDAEKGVGEERPNPADWLLPKKRGGNETVH